MKTKKSTFIVLIGAIALVVISVTGTLFFTQPVGYLSIDVNPSVEFSFNRLNRVVEAKSLNPEADALFEGKDFKGVDIDDVVREIFIALLDSDYLTQEQSMILFSTDDRNFSNEVLQRIKNEAVVWLKDYYEDTILVSQSINLKDTEIEVAHELGMSAGKYNLVKNILSNSQSKSINSLMNMTVGELLGFALENQIKLDMIYENEQDGQLVGRNNVKSKGLDNYYFGDTNAYIGVESAKEIAFSNAGIDV